MENTKRRVHVTELFFSIFLDYLESPKEAVCVVKSLKQVSTICKQKIQEKRHFQNPLYYRIYFQKIIHLQFYFLEKQQQKFQKKKKRTIYRSQIIWKTQKRLFMLRNNQVSVCSQKDPGLDTHFILFCPLESGEVDVGEEQYR